MKFLFKYMSEPFDFSKSNAVTLVIENKKLFRHTILSVSECNCNEMFVFSENFKPLDFSKSVKYVDSVLTFEFSDRKMMTKVNSFKIFQTYERVSWNKVFYCSKSAYLS